MLDADVLEMGTTILAVSHFPRREGAMYTVHRARYTGFIYTLYHLISFDHVTNADVLQISLACIRKDGGITDITSHIHMHSFDRTVAVATMVRMAKTSHPRSRRKWHGCIPSDSLI